MEGSWWQVGVSRAVWEAKQPAATASKAVVRPRSHADWACSAVSGGGGDKARPDWCVVWLADLGADCLFHALILSFCTWAGWAQWAAQVAPAAGSLLLG